MDYNIDFGIWGSIFPVPTAIADKHLKLCSESQIKVLLLALRDAPNTVDIQYIGKRLGLSPTQVSDALEYWQQAGVLVGGDAPCASAAAHKA
ncbi:MAG: primosomal replication protein N, partial [Angelakisella sp.]